MIAYKVLNGGSSLFTGTRWPLPVTDAPGAWVAVDGPLGLCENGLHACTAEQLPPWIGDELWTVELDGEILRTPLTLVARRARLVERVAAWDADGRARFIDDCWRRATASVTDRPDLQEALSLVRAFADLGIAASVAYWSAVLAGDAVATGRSGPDYEAAFARERSAQARWLRAELALSG